MDKRKRSAVKLATAIIWGLLFINSAFSADIKEKSALESIKYESLADNQLKLQLHFSTAVSMPKSFNTDDPQRIWFDFSNVSNNLKNKNQIVDVGALHKIISIEAKDRTRVILDLKKKVKSKITPENNDWIVTLEGEKIASNTSTTIGHGLTKIDFKGTQNNSGKLVVGLTDEAGGVDVQRLAQKILVTFPKTALPQRLEHSYQVASLGSPVDKIEALRKGDDTQLVLNMRGDYKHLAYQVDKQFIVDVHPEANNQATAEPMRRSYVGKRISLNFQDIKVRSVLQLIADFTGQNIVVSDSVKGNITLRLKNIPWDEALGIILKTRGLTKRRVGNITMIAPANEVAAQEKLDLEAVHQVDELIPVVSELIQVNYAKAEDLAALLKTKGSSLLSPRGNVSVDSRTNNIWIQDTAPRVYEIRKLVRRLDVPVKQVLIEARIVSVTKDFEHELGIRWGVTDPNHFTGTLRGASTMLQTGNPVAVPFEQRLNVNLPSIGPGTTTVGLALANLGKDFLLDLELSAMESEDRGDVIANPRLITANQSTARIESGQEIPYQQSTSSGATAIAFKKAVLSLEVTPQITPDRKLVLHLDIHKDDPLNVTVSDANGGISNQIPAIITKQIQTNVLVDNGETIVLGGVYQQNSNNQITRVPFFGSIPIIGYLFRHTSISNKREELLIFITPKIIIQQDA